MFLATKYCLGIQDCKVLGN